jgi:predicted nucleic acid-binding protein
MEILVDASAVIGCLMNEPQREELLFAAEGRSLLAPVSLPWEIGNAFSAMFKQRRIRLDDAIAGIKLFRTMPIEFREIDLEKAVMLASRLGIYAYDAYMLQCALDNQVQILTLDRGLKAAARIAGVSICEV